MWLTNVGLWSKDLVDLFTFVIHSQVLFFCCVEGDKSTSDSRNYGKDTQNDDAKEDPFFPEWNDVVFRPLIGVFIVQFDELLASLIFWEENRFCQNLAKAGLWIALASWIVKQKEKDKMLALFWYLLSLVSGR